MRKVLPLVFLSAITLFGAPKEKADKTEKADKSEKSDKADKADKKAARAAKMEAFYKDTVLRLNFTISPEGLKELGGEDRKYVEVTMTEAGKAGSAPIEHEHVGVKLKGAGGSFQKIDEKPSLTLSFDKFKGGDRFYGQDKLHINNCNEDGTYLREWFAGELARACGVPAGRCAHAMVSINGKERGLYVVREGFTKDFLFQQFGDNDGGFFEGAFCNDLKPDLEMERGKDEDKEALKTLIAACEENAPLEERWLRLGRSLDLESFAAFFAFESVAEFSDSYDFYVNNYRLYRHPKDGKFRFVLHGMDEVMKNPETPLIRSSKSMVGRLFLSHPEGKKLVREKMNAFVQILADPKWPTLMTAKTEVLRNALTVYGVKAKEMQQYEKQWAEQLERLKTRVAFVQKEITDWPEPLTFDKDGTAPLTQGWRVENENGDAVELANDAGTLRVTAKDESTASWRRAVPLEAGRYRFEAKVRTESVRASDDEKGKGAGLRISGTKEKRTNQLDGTATWAPLQFEFSVDENTDVVLVAELRANQGSAWFQDLRLIRIK